MKYICRICGKPTDNIKVYNNGITSSWCDECEDRWSREYDYQQETETIDEESLICPHCGHEYEAIDAYDYDEGETEGIKCESCGKRFDLEIEVVRRYSTKRSVSEMPEDYGKAAGGENDDGTID